MEAKLTQLKHILGLTAAAEQEIRRHQPLLRQQPLHTYDFQQWAKQHLPLKSGAPPLFLKTFFQQLISGYYGEKFCLLIQEQTTYWRRMGVYESHALVLLNQASRQLLTEHVTQQHDLSTSLRLAIDQNARQAPYF